MGEQDQETRARLLNAAARLFAERGFARVTVRDICKKARANVAAVNYHFGGKDGLYQAVMRMAMETMQATTEAARTAGRNLTPEERIRAYVSVFAERLLGIQHETWIHQLMLREMSDPTPALKQVADEVLKPRMAYLCGTIAELLGCPPDDPRAVRCALSVTSQFNSMLWTKAVAELMNAPGAVGSPIDAIAEHITQFSLGGIQQVRLKPDATDDSRRKLAGAEKQPASGKR
jgi:TetR/AcrR family transcriptional regulator, regulator of cefoperazone and chloramphenicol sensitivity